MVNVFSSNEEKTIFKKEGTLRKTKEFKIHYTETITIKNCDKLDKKTTKKCSGSIDSWRENQ